MVSCDDGDISGGSLHMALGKVAVLRTECERLKEREEALLAENDSLRRGWLHLASHDVALTAEINEEHGVDLAKIPISEATLAAVNTSIDREPERLQAH